MLAKVRFLLVIVPFKPHLGEYTSLAWLPVARQHPIVAPIPMEDPDEGAIPKEIP